ncbi:MAG: peptidoglycan-binding protein [Nitrosomonas sp.]|nr:peptidoglycan-binding protein [Nitrosomonas sp.]
MPELAKAQLIELNQDFISEKEGVKKVDVQFNPESLKLTYANQLVQPDGGDQASGTAGRQFVGVGTTKLSLQLWFDVTAMQEDPVDDVRRLTQKVTHFMVPQELEGADDAGKLVPPGVRFSWGSFVFDGMVEGLEETIEFFSPDGKPLRASITLALSQQKILKTNYGEEDGRVPQQPGHRPLTSAKAGDSLQNMAARTGKTDWQSIAAMNAVEDPLRLSSGKLVDLNVRAGSIGRIPLENS